VARLTAIGQHHPKLLAVQLVLAQKCMDVQDIDGAVAAATRAAQLAPELPGPYRLLVDAHDRAGKWEQAIEAAQKWRNCSPEHSLEADLAIARALIQLNRPTQARGQLQAYFNDPKSPSYAAALTVLSTSGPRPVDPDMNVVLEPQLSTSSASRMTWIGHAARDLAPDAAAAALRRVASAIPRDANDEWIALADAWGALADRSGEKKYVQEGRAVLEPIAAREDAPVAVVLGMARRLDQHGDAAGAETMYRRVISSGASGAELVIAQNNLAVLLVRRDDAAALTQARRLIDDALAAEPALAPLHDTRALVLSQAGDFTAAVAAMYAAVQLQPGSVEYRVHLAEVLLQAGQRQRVVEALAELDKMPQAAKPMSPALRQRLETLRGAIADRTASAADGARAN
jgi:tetratricopeptide (TPR) repeat protein